MKITRPAGKELRKLQWGDLLLDEPNPCIKRRAQATKAKRSDTIPLDPELAECLLQARPENASPADPVFRRVPSFYSYQKDLAKAGIDYRDEQGRYADFHALRMSYNMLLAKQGVAPRVAQELMRHSYIRLTMHEYTDPKLLDMRGAVNKLRRLKPETPTIPESAASTTSSVG